MKRIVVIAAAVLGGCASHPEDIETAYVSPLHYKNFDCEQLEMEAERVSRRAQELHGSLEKTADTDDVQMGVGLILFWPVLFWLEGSDDYRAQEYSRLKGERDAIERASIQKKCAIEFQPIVPPEDEEEAPEKLGPFQPQSGILRGDPPTLPG